MRHYLNFILLATLWCFQLNAFETNELHKRIEALEELQVSSERLGEELKNSLRRGKNLSGSQMNRLTLVIELYHKDLTPLIVEARANPLQWQIIDHDEESLKHLMLHTEITRHIFSILKTYFQQHDLRRLVTDLLKTNPSQENLFNESFEDAKYFLQKENLDVLVKQLNILKELMKNNGMEDFNDKELFFVSKIMRDNLAQTIRSGPDLPGKIKLLIDSTAHLIQTLTSYGSWLVGNTAGNIRWRKGHMLHHQRETQEIQLSLRPFDILVEKAPFILTDYMIPGHFGHAAIYIGNEEQLKDLKLWDHPAVIPFQKEIRQGYNIIEAVRSGVRLTKFSKFINIDELSILRLKDFMPTAKVLTVAMDQIGKEYDFNFDVRNPIAVICSEIIYLILGHISWPHETIMGRPTISPDHLVELLFYRNSPLEFVGHWKATKTKIENLSIAELAKKLSYVPVNRSESGIALFDKEKEVCSKVIRRNIRVSNSRRRHLQSTVCHKELVTSTYLSHSDEASLAFVLQRTKLSLKKSPVQNFSPRMNPAQ